jgi:hypothetical protein
LLRITHLTTVALFTCVAAALLFASCGGGDGSPDAITGLLTEVRVDAQDQPTFVRIRDAEARIWELEVQFDPGAEVSAAHLRDHYTQRLPVVASVRETENGLYAYRLDDVTE